MNSNLKLFYLSSYLSSGLFILSKSDFGIAIPSVRRAIPKKSILMPTSNPMTQNADPGHPDQMIAAKARERIPLNTSQNQLAKVLNWKAKITFVIP
jgi:hypothetical protein